MENLVTFVPKVPTLKARFLSEDEQLAYEEACKMYKSERARKALNVPRNGSNFFKVNLLNQIGIRTATLAELDQIIIANDALLSGTYEDVSS